MNHKNNSLYIQIFLSAFLLALFLYIIIRGSASLPGYDAYYHIQMADLMISTGNWAIKEFPWTTCSIWSSPFFNKDWLFHVYLVPFVFVFGKITGAKIAIIFSTFIIALSWGFLLKTLKVRHILPAMLFMFFCVGYIYPGRLLLCRGHLASIFFMPIVLNFAIQKKRIPLMLSIYLYTLSYVGACQMVPIIFIFDLFNIKKDFKIKELIKEFMLPWALLGFISALIISPYFPVNIMAIYTQVIVVLKAQWFGVESSRILPIGIEFLPIQPKHFVLYIPLFFIYLFSINDLIKRKLLFKITPICKAFFLLTLLYLVMTVFTQKFIEYLAPCFTVTIFLYWTNHPHKLWSKLYKKPSFIYIRNCICVLLLLLIAVPSISLLRKNFYKNHLIYKDSAEWIRKNVKEKKLIFTGDWDDNVILFYHLPNYKTLVILEPFFMYAKSPEKFIIWQKIVDGKVQDTAGAIRSNFDTETVFVPPDRQKLKHRLLMNDASKLVYEGKSGESVFILE